jgi:hypothetical protein
MLPFANQRGGPVSSRSNDDEAPKRLSRLGWYMQLGSSRMNTTLRFSSFGLIADTNLSWVGWSGVGAKICGAYDS